MMQIIKQTDEEKMAMYMKVPKKKLAEMLIQCNKALDMHYVESKISSSAVLKEGVCQCFEPVNMIDVAGMDRCGWCFGKIRQANSLL